MKKLLFILLLFVAANMSAQGIKLSGVTYTDPSTHYHIDSLFSYPSYFYNSIDSTLFINIPVCISQADAKAKNQIKDAQAYQIPAITYVGKSTIGYPTSSSLYNLVKPWLQTTYGFTVTTF